MKEKVLAEMLEGNFDYYRECYDDLSFEDIAFISRGFGHTYLDKTFFHLENILKIFNLIFEKCPTQRLSVIEIGCHRGQLANEILKKFSKHQIPFWIGYDISSIAVQNTIEVDRYSPVLLDDWFYNRHSLPLFNTVVCLHTFEHMKLKSIKKTLKRIDDCNHYLILELPIRKESRDWDESQSTHILEVGYDGLSAVIKSFGYKLFYQENLNVKGLWVSGWEKLRR